MELRCGPWGDGQCPGTDCQCTHTAGAHREENHSSRREGGINIFQAVRSHTRWFPPRTFVMLSEDGQQLIADLLNIFQSTGLWATANSTAHMKLTKTPQWGKAYRMVQGSFRLWCALISDELRDWEATYATDTCFGACKWSSVVDVGWRQAARSDIAQISGRHLVLVSQYPQP